MKKFTNILVFILGLAMFSMVAFADDENDETSQKAGKSVAAATSETMDGIKSTIDLRGLIADLKKANKGLSDIDSAIARALEAEDLDTVERLIEIRKNYLTTVEYSSSRKAECSKNYAAKELRCSSSHEEHATVPVQ